MMRLFVYLVLFLLLVAPVHAEPAQPDYRVGSGDVLKISVYDNDDLETVTRINSDGSIQFPLIGQVDLSGLTVALATARIEAMLADGYLINPQVSVFIEEYRSKKVVIMGQVKKPGVFELSTPTSLLEMISKAGGLREEAGSKLTVSRTLSGEGGATQKVIDIDLQRLLETGDSALNLMVMDQDNIFITKAGLVYIVGEVKKPGSYKYEDGATVLKIVSMAGDFEEFAAEKKVRIIRVVDGAEQTFERVPLQEPVLPGDVIEVPESFF